MIGFFKAIGSWFRRQFTPSDAAWRAATWALVAFAVALIAVDAVVSVLRNFTFERFLGMGVMLIIPLVVALLSLLLYWFTKSLKASYRFAMLIVIPFAMMTGGAAWGIKGGLIFSAATILSLSFFFGGLASLRQGNLSFRKHWLTVPVFLLGLGGFSAMGYAFFFQTEVLNPTLAAYVHEDRTLDLPNPGDPGAFEFKTMTYGSGTDKHRAEFASDVDITTQSVDGSKLVDRWSGPVGWARTRYWGFDDTELPLQGRVWMPEGDGPFPLVLVVHGNHGMEDFSDPGYAYLGQHLASHGYILVSVDENFLNSSLADMLNPIDPGIGRENDARGWVLLEHLKLWRGWMDDASHQLFGKADLSRIVLIGHSRGGEAVAHAAAFNRLKFYPDDATLEFDYNFDIGGIIAIAPADGQYRPRNRFTLLKDVNYFTIHGSLDGDVQSFMGASQFSRVDFSGEEFHFKSSLYIDGANHGQFNTSWGRNDFGMPFGWFLDTGQIMNPEDQRDIARVYFTAFLETVLKDNGEYRPLFEDSRAGANWLPQTFYISNYEDSDTNWIATFEEDLDPSTATAPGATIVTRSLSKWRESWISLKWNTLDTHTGLFAWDERVSEETASVSFILGNEEALANDALSLVFSAAQSESGTLPSDFEDEDPEDVDTEEQADDEPEETIETDDEEVEIEEPLDWTIVLVDQNGQEARLPLSHDMPLHPQVKTKTRRIGFLEETASSEVLLRHYAFALSDFVDVNSAFNPTQLREVHFEFDQSPRGSIIIDNLGLR